MYTKTHPVDIQETILGFKTFKVRTDFNIMIKKSTCGHYVIQVALQREAGYYS